MTCISTRQKADEKEKMMSLKNIKYKKDEIIKEGFGASALVLMLAVFVSIFILLSSYI